MFIAEIALHLLGDLMLYSLGRLVIIVLSLGRVRPMSLAELWRIRAQKDLAMAHYWEIGAIQFVGMLVLFAILFLCLALHR